MQNILKIGQGHFLICLILSVNCSYIENFLTLGFNVLGIEPSANVAAASIKRDIPTRVDFFSHEMAVSLKKEGYRPKVILGNNVLAHVPDIVDFLSGIAHLLSSESIAVIEYRTTVSVVVLKVFEAFNFLNYDKGQHFQRSGGFLKAQ
jgi:2-polyprenyl-3-methyl-5-hydroxy-6-metoxy-1,4-benzoquinol methylase